MSCATEHAPSCTPPTAGLLFFPGVAGPSGPKGDAGPIGPQGVAGPSGPTVSYAGSYTPNGPYFSNDMRKDIVDYSGGFWIADNPAKNGLTTWDAPTTGADWLYYGNSLKAVATVLRLLEAANIDVGLNIRSPGYLKSDNFVQFESGVLISGFGRLEAYDALIAGAVSTNSPRFNLQSVNRTMPSTGIAISDITSVGAIPENPTINHYTNDSLIVFGWLRGPNILVSNRFGNASQRFGVTVSGIGQNNSSGSQFLYVQIYYRTRVDGGSWSAWTKEGPDAYVQKLASLDQSFQLFTNFGVTLAGNQDIQFSAGFSVGSGGSASVSSGEISVQAFN